MFYADRSWLVGSRYWELTGNYDLEPITPLMEGSIKLHPLAGKQHHLIEEKKCNDAPRGILTLYCCFPACVCLLWKRLER